MKHLLVLCGVIGLTTPLGNLITNNEQNVHASTLATDVKNYLTPDYYRLTVHLFINYQTWMGDNVKWIPPEF